MDGGKTAVPHLATEKTMVTPYSEVGHIKLQKWFMLKKKKFVLASLRS